MSNPLSQLGRMSYQLHLLTYPTVLTIGYLFGKPYMKQRKEAAAKAEWDSLPKPRAVDPDLFNPFSPIPYHNSREVKYATDHIRLHGYVNKNHLNVKEYAWKSYHNSYDHNDDCSYMYNWTSTTKPMDA